MSNRNIEIVQNLFNGLVVAKIEVGSLLVQNSPNLLSKKRKLALVDLKGNIKDIVDLKNCNLGLYFFDEYSVNECGDIIIGVKSNGNLKYGVINRNGLLVIEPQYDMIKYANEDAFIVGLLTFSKKFVYGYKDALTGEKITPICFKSASDFHYHKAVVRYDDKYGYIDRSKILTNPKNKSEYADNLYPRFYSATDLVETEALALFHRGTVQLPPVYATINQRGEITSFTSKRHFGYQKIMK